MQNKIEQMAKDLCHTETCEVKKIGTPCYQRCKAYIYAERAVDKGYRKASDVAREIIDDLESGILPSGKGLYSFPVITHKFIAELKKKYTENKGE